MFAPRKITCKEETEQPGLAIFTRKASHTHTVKYLEIIWQLIWRRGQKAIHRNGVLRDAECVALKTRLWLSVLWTLRTRYFLVAKVDQVQMDVVDSQQALFSPGQTLKFRGKAAKF